MSLLMDALKKAETVKQERAQAQEEHPEAPLPEDPGPALADLDASGLELEMESAALNPAPADEDDLIPVLEDVEILMEETGPEGLTPPRTVSAEPEPPPAAPEGLTPPRTVSAEPEPPPAAPEGLTKPRTVSAEPEPPPAGPVDLGPAADDGAANVRPATPASDSAGPAQAGPEAQARAANLFRAKAPVRPKPGRRVLLWAAIALIAVLAAAGQGYRIWQAQTRPSLISTGSAVNPPPAVMAPRPDPTPPPAAETPAEALPVSGSVHAPASDQTTTALVAGAPATPTALPPATAVPTQDGLPSRPPAAHPSAESNPPRPAPSPDAAPPSQGTGTVSDSVTRQVPAPSAPKAPAPKPPAVKSAGPSVPPDRPTVTRVEIRRTHRQDPIDALVASAYQAFMAKDFQAARQGYRKALESDPNLRDALAGLAAIAVVAGDPDEAGRMYTRMLELNPHDALAQAGIMAYSTDAPQSEARIKTMIDRQPQVPFLYFVLGNHYAARSNWPSAQQAFFDALRRDPNNPDYAFNLAVSLEHLGQTQRAAEQYRNALDLSQHRPFAFDRDTARARVEKLAAGRMP